MNDKHEDPAVICVDSMGLNAISVLSGHIGGANDLAREVAGIIGAREVITTQSDNAGLWALDTFAERFNWAIASDDDMNMEIEILVNYLREGTAGKTCIVALRGDHFSGSDDACNLTGQIVRPSDMP